MHITEVPICTADCHPVLFVVAGLAKIQGKGIFIIDKPGQRSERGFGFEITHRHLGAIISRGTGILLNEGVRERTCNEGEGSVLLAETTGNLIFTEWGMNGPAVMDLSHHISTRPGAKLELRFNPIFDREERLRDLLKDLRATPTPLATLLGSVVPPKLAAVIVPMGGLAPGITLDRLKDAQIEKVLGLLKAMPFTVTGVRGFEYCQVSAGGVPTAEVDPLTMRSLKLPGLWLTGETVDVIGPCGGYNLQFAFSSGAIAGRNIN